MGRAFTEAETTLSNRRVAILTDAYWRQHFNADPHVIGRQIRVDGLSKTVIGVLPPGFRFLSSEAQLYFPLASSPEDRAPSQRHSGGNVTHMIARLKPGAALTQAQSQIDAQNATLETDDPQAKMMADAGFRSLVVPLHADHVAAIRPTLLLLQAGVLLLLLIGAVNLVNLLLIRASGRVKELAVRQALGASRRHVVSEVLVETTLLTLAGGLLGLGVGAGGIRLLAALGADRLPLGRHIAFDARLALVALAAAVAMGIVLAAPIAWFNLRHHLDNALQSETRGGTAGRAAQTLRHSFIVAQIALGIRAAGRGRPARAQSQARDGRFSGLPVRSRSHGPNLSAVERLSGRDRPGLLSSRSSLDELGHQPGVLSAGVVNNVPFSGNSGKSAATVKGHVLRPGRIAARALLLRRRRRLLPRHGLLVASRAIPHGCRFAPRRASLCGG